MTTFLLRRRWPLGLVLFAVFAAFGFVAGNAYVLRLCTIYGCIYAIVLAGLNVLTGGTGQVSIGQVGFYIIGAYAGGLCARSMPWVVAAVIAIVLAVLAGLIIGFPALRLRGAYLTLATLAFALIVIGVLTALPAVLSTGGAITVTDVPRPIFGPIALTDPLSYYLFCLLVAAPIVAVSRNVFWSATGRQLLALGDDENAAASLGIGIVPAKLAAFCFSAGCAGLAGVLLASTNGIVSPTDFTTGESLRFVIALLIGGLAAPVAGPVAGAVATVLLVYVGQTLFQENEVMLGAILLLAVLAFAPRGIGGLGRRLLSALRLGWLTPGGTLVGGAVVRHGGTVGDFTSLRSADAGADAAAITTVVGGIHAAPVTYDGAGAVVPRLEVHNLAKSYGGVRAVDDVSFTVAPGSIHVLMGPNGSGKSSVLNVVSGLVRSDQGTIRLDGADITGLAAHERARAGIARTFQEIQLFGSLTVLENCTVGFPTTARVGSQILRLPSSVREEAEHADAALALLEAWGLAEFADRPAAAMSYGQRKMLELARAAARRPKLLLVDEPSAGLNPRWVATMVEALSGLRSAGLTLLVVEHHQDVIADLADLVTVLDRGRVIAEGPAASVQRDPNVIAVYLGTARG